MPRTSSKRSASSSASSKRRKTKALRSNMSIPQIMRAAAKPITVVQRAVGVVSYNPASGWNSTGLGNSLVLAWTQGQTYYSIGGAAYANFGSQFSNFTGFQACYDMYRVGKIWIDIYPSINSNSINQATTYSPVMVYCTPDYTDGNPIASANDALAYSDVKVFQMVADSKESGKTKFQLQINKPTCNVGVDSINTGVTTNSMSARAPWLYTSNTTAEIGFAKFFADCAISTAAVTLQLTMVVNCEFQFKNVR